jgi:hypothetical protein
LWGLSGLVPTGSRCCRLRRISAEEKGVEVERDGMGEVRRSSALPAARYTYSDATGAASVKAPDDGCWERSVRSFVLRHGRDRSARPERRRRLLLFLRFHEKVSATTSRTIRHWRRETGSDREAEAEDDAQVIAATEYVLIQMKMAKLPDSRIDRFMQTLVRDTLGEVKASPTNGARLTEISQRRRWARPAGR